MVNNPFTISRYNLRLYADSSYAIGRDKLIDVLVTTEVVPGITEAFSISEETLRCRFQAGNTCFIARDNSKFMAILWGYNNGDCYIRGAGKRLSIGPKDVYAYGGYTLPEFRNVGALTSMLVAFCRYYSHRGVERTFALTASDNALMWNKLRRMGWTELSYLVFIRLGRIGLLRERTLDSAKGHLTLMTKEPRDCYVI